MNRRFFSLAGLLPALGLAVAARAEIQVRTEQVNPGSPAWAFQKIPGPSKSDAAQHCPVVAVGNSFDPVGSDAAALTDGRMPAKAWCRRSGARTARPGRCSSGWVAWTRRRIMSLNVLR